MEASWEPQVSAWERHYQQYVAVDDIANRQEANQRIAEIVRQARALLARSRRDEDAWVHAVLRDQERKWFVARVMAANVPRRFFAVMLRAAVNERNPSANRRFVEPCVRSYGRRHVTEALLEYVERGTNFEKAGAVNALYWAGVSGPSMADRRSGEEAVLEAQVSWVAMLERKRRLLLHEFVANDDVEVRRSIIGKLSLDPAAYPDDLKPLVPLAIAIARRHPDPYIRHRAEIQLGVVAGPMQPLPQRRPLEG